ncbi:MAG TPA: hypothetical protein VMV86_00710 [Methanosarcinales archaeon]|nr:hypothetical protein [Methanosarcinales archaeon]
MTTDEFIKIYSIKENADTLFDDALAIAKERDKLKAQNDDLITSIEHALVNLHVVTIHSYLREAILKAKELDPN